MSALHDLLLRVQNLLKSGALAYGLDGDPVSLR